MYIDMLTHARAVVPALVAITVSLVLLGCFAPRHKWHYWLPDNLRKRCRRLYEHVNPYKVRDLTGGDEEPAITCGTHVFRCGTEFLFAGVVEVIYLMRCSLFHGELVPTRKASECYEPAYRIVRRFLEAVT